MEKLRYYLANNRGLEVRVADGRRTEVVGRFFPEHTVEDLKGLPSDPATVFCAIAFNGAYRTRDGGKTWEKILDVDARTFTIDPHDENVIYLGAGPIRLYRSVDCGSSWEPIDTMLDFSPEVKKKWGPAPGAGIDRAHARHIFVHPDDRDILVVLLEHGGVLLSRDGGKSWDDRSSGIDYLDMHMLQNYPGSTERYVVSSARGFFTSDDAGRTWVRMEQGMPWTGSPMYCYSHDMQFLEGSDKMIVCGARGSPGRWMEDAGNPHGYIMIKDGPAAAWRFASDGLSRDNPWMPWVLVNHPTDPKTLFVGMGTGARGYFLHNDERGSGALYRSPDGGESWEPVFTDEPSILTAWVAAD